MKFKVNLTKKRFNHPFELAPQMLQVLGVESPYVDMDQTKEVINPELLKKYKYEDISNFMRYGATSPEGQSIYLLKKSLSSITSFA